MSVSPEQLDKYARGLCSSEEKALIEKWLLEEEISEDLPPVETEKEDLANVWNEVRIQHPHKNRLQRKTAVLVLKIAACLLLLCMAGLFYRHLDASQPASKYLATKKGERAKIKLSDGTMVFLNAESRLKYPEQFTDTIRMVELTGEAFFNVAKNAAQPFVIHTAKTETRVLGTQFNVKAYPEEETRISVKEGKVWFANRSRLSDQTILIANQSAYLVDGAPIRREITSIETSTAWLDNKLVINDQKLADIALQLERWYGIDVQISSADIGNIRCSGTFINQTLDKVIKSLCYSTGLRYTFKNAHYFIY